MLNVRRYSTLPSLPAYHVNDDGGIVLHDDDDEEEGGGDEPDCEITMIKRSIGYGKR